MGKKGCSKKKNKASSVTWAQEPSTSPEDEVLVTRPEDEMAEQPTEPPAEEYSSLNIPVLNDYKQVTECPYTSPIITLKVQDMYYKIPQHYLRPYKSLLFELNSVRREIFGDYYHHELNVHPEVAHTFVHYLYTEQYETPETQFEPPQSADDIPAITKARDSIEFQRAVYAYQAAARYQIPGLLSMAQGFTARFAERLSINDILRAIRCVYGSLIAEYSCRMWLEDFVRDQLSIAFSITDGKLRQIIKEYEVGHSRSFDLFLVDEVLALYEREQDRVNHVKSLDNSRREHDPMLQPEPMLEPYCEPVCEPPYEEPYREPACEPEPLFRSVAEEAIPTPAPEPEPEPIPEPDSLAPEIPDCHLYDNWNTLTQKDRRKRERSLIKIGFPIPGKDFELPVPDYEPPAAERESSAERSEPPAAEPEPPELDDGWGFSTSASSKKRKNLERLSVNMGHPIPGGVDIASQVELDPKTEDPTQVVDKEALGL
ncbi:hypothetical protein CBS147323_3756 [Aspergillus niger]|nr:hypothetical protein CBS133816_119 [Aspergillus niger]KAI2969670.1 hypothetical protein CBS147323_3756 [Aspergillus niger]KAI2973256.1 hypothetical protein CBS147324_4033 [Aspergillus niger]KAI3032550.1 hypothetical protein CBS147345_1164 [Aspergillus niger]KAI3054069.1 hypothetical protein CBS147352_4017 [Aspergillus niger]